MYINCDPSVNWDIDKEAVIMAYNAPCEFMIMYGIKCGENLEHINTCVHTPHDHKFYLRILYIWSRNNYVLYIKELENR